MEVGSGTSFDEGVPELLGENAAVVLDVDGLEDEVELELLGVHVAAELGVVDAAVAVGVADLEEVLGVLVLRGNLEGGEAGLDLRVVKVAEVGGVEEVE